MKLHGIMRHTNRGQRRSRTKGFTIVECIFSMIIFMMMILVFAAVFPFAVRTAQFSNNYAQASLIAQRKIDQLLAAGHDKLDYTDLSGLGIIDTTATSSPYSFTTVDNLVGGNGSTGYFMPGSTGAVTIVDYHTVNSSVTAGQMDYVTVTLKWNTEMGSIGTYSASAIL